MELWIVSFIQSFVVAVRFLDFVFAIRNHYKLFYVYIDAHKKCHYYAFML